MSIFVGKASIFLRIAALCYLEITNGRGVFKSPPSFLTDTTKTLNRSSFEQRERKMYESCKKMSLNISYCDKYESTGCHQYFTSKNLSSSRTCNDNNTPTKESINAFFRTLQLPIEGDEDCTEIEKWIICSVIYPECNRTNAQIKLPCKDICIRGEASACRPGTLKRFHRLQLDIFNRRFIPSCADLPSSQNDCDFPQFIAKILNRNENESNTRSSTIEYVGIGVGIVILIALIIIVVVGVYHRRKRNPYIYTGEMSLEDIHTIHRNVGTTSHMLSDNDGLLDNKSYKSLDTLINAKGINRIARSNLVFMEYLGEGEFGKVVKCSTHLEETEAEITLVAVKYLKDDASDALETNFLEEVRILSHFKHPHLIPLLGVCVDSRGPKCIVLEFMKYGDLNQYLRDRSGSYYALAGSQGNGVLPDNVEYQSPQISFHKLLYIMKQIADGVSYLATKRFVHRDLATRNILVGDDFHVKVADFGMARDIYGSDYYRVDSKRMLPLRWLSPEALTIGKFTIYSDVWAFGILMWEVFTYGMQPFGGYSNEEICDQIRRHKLLPKPYGCPKQIYDLIKSCWKFEPTHRKCCSVIKDTITKWLEDEETFIEVAWKHLSDYYLVTSRHKFRRNKRHGTIHEREVTL